MAKIDNSDNSEEPPEKKYAEIQHLFDICVVYSTWKGENALIYKGATEYQNKVKMDDIPY